MQSTYLPTLVALDLMLSILWPHSQRALVGQLNHCISLRSLRILRTLEKAWNALLLLAGSVAVGIHASLELAAPVLDDALG